MQRKEKKARSGKVFSPLMPLLPLLLVATVLQGIIAIFSEIQCPILVVDFLLICFYCSVLILEVQNAYRDQAFQQRGDLYKLLGWLLTSHSFIKIQIENGMVATDRPLANQRKLLSIDPASAAAILRTPDRQIEVISSGIYCLDKNQSILSAFDLRTQTVLFPAAGAAKQASYFNPLPQQTSQTPLPSTFLTATTNDAYQVGARFLVHYKYNSEFGEGENPYGFNPSILLKVHEHDTLKPGVMLDPQLLSRNRIQQVIQTIWQTSIQQVSLLDLIPQEDALPSALEKIELDMRSQLTTTIAKDDISSIPEIRTPLQQLQDYGLKVLSISVQSFWLPEETEIAIQHHWQPHTRQLVNGLQILQQHKTTFYQELGEMQALYAFLAEQGRIG
jgi:hypothetical protein